MSALTTISYVKEAGGITVNTYDTFLTDRINAVSTAIESYCRRSFAIQSYTVNVDGAGTTELLLPQYPIGTVTQIVKDFYSSQPTTIPGSALIVNNSTGIISVAPNGGYNPWFGYGNQNIQVTYTAGYSPIPDDLQEACAQAVLVAYNRMGKDLTLSMEKIGDYQYINKSDVMKLLPDDIMATLNYYRQSII